MNDDLFVAAVLKKLLENLRLAVQCCMAAANPHARACTLWVTRPLLVTPPFSASSWLFKIIPDDLVWPLRPLLPRARQLSKSCLTDTAGMQVRVLPCTRLVPLFRSSCRRQDDKRRKRRAPRPTPRMAPGPTPRMTPRATPRMTPGATPPSWITPRAAPARSPTPALSGGDTAAVKPPWPPSVSRLEWDQTNADEHSRR